MDQSSAMAPAGRNGPALVCSTYASANLPACVGLRELARSWKADDERETVSIISGRSLIVWCLVPCGFATAPRETGWGRSDASEGRIDNGVGVVVRKRPDA
jgi:hypothetical protein